MRLIRPTPNCSSETTTTEKQNTRESLKIRYVCNVPHECMPVCIFSTHAMIGY